MTHPPLERDLEATFARLSRGLLAQALAIVGDAALAEDVLQDAFVRVWGRRERLRDRGRLDGYLYAAVRNLALDQLRRRRTRSEHQAKLAVKIVTTTPTGPDAERIDRALAELPPEQREVVVLRVHLGLSFPEVAERTQSPLGTVHSRYRYAMTQLRERLVQEQPPGGAS